MTNPLPKVIWQKILTYWFAVKKSENGKQPHKGPIPDADKLREFWEFDAKTHGQQLQEMLDLDLKGEEPEDQDITDSTWKPFFYGPDNPIFQFYVLGPDSPYGQFIAGPILGDNMWDADQRNQALLEPDWVPISPMADWSDAWLHFHYQEDFRGLTTGQTVPLKPQTVQRLQDDEKDFRDYCDKQHQGDVRWLIDRYDKAPLLAPQNSPAYDQEETAIYNDFAGMGEHQIRSVAHSC
jgi:hypothetical protein